MTLSLSQVLMNDDVRLPTSSMANTLGISQRWHKFLKLILKIIAGLTCTCSKHLHILLRFRYLAAAAKLLFLKENFNLQSQ